MTSPKLTPELIEWSRLAGYALTPEDDSGAALFWSDPGGEIRFYIRHNAEGGVTLTKAERAGEEQFELSAVSMDVLERYLFGLFGWSMRSKNRLPRIKTPRKIDEVVDGFRISDVDAEGFRRLSDPNSETIAAALGKVSAVSLLVELSHLVASPIEAITGSYQDVEGRPLFRV